MSERELDVNALGNRVKEYRKAKNYSAEKLGEMIGVTQSHITNIESGNSRASAEILVRIANALDVSLDILLCDSLSVKVHQKARMTEYARILDECSASETKVIVDTVKALKSSLREHNMKE